MPTDVVLPHIIYENVAEALAWLTKAFGFTEHYRYGEPGGPVNGTQMYLGDAWNQLRRLAPTFTPRRRRVPRERRFRAWRPRPARASAR